MTQTFSDFYVFLTVNSVIKTNFLGLGADSRRIEMNWTPPPGGYKAGDWVGLFRKDAAGFSISGEVHNTEIYFLPITNFINVPSVSGTWYSTVIYLVMQINFVCQMLTRPKYLVRSTVMVAYLSGIRGTIRLVSFLAGYRKIS